ncbi:MAG TPA: molybdenum ABC transporter ATP-binding protein [Burkholderiales bacterium]
MTLDVRIGMRLGDFALDVAFAAGNGVTALFGPSGSGKTSVLNAIAGLLKPASGRIALDDRVFFDGRTWLAPRERRIGYVFQEARLLPHLNVRQNLLYGRFFSPEREHPVELDRVLELLDLARLLSRRPQNLSGGEKQRVAIGRALLASPRLMLMDEPLASLDASRKAEILYYIERLRDELGLPMVFVSHSVEEVVRLADTVVVLAEGKVADRGSVVGHLQGGAVIESTVAEQDLRWGLARLQFAGGSLYAADVNALVGERVRVRVRAQDVALATVRPASLSMLNVLPATVKSIADAAASSVDVQLDLGGAELVARITRKSLAELGLAPGKPVFALIKSVAIDRVSVGYA